MATPHVAWLASLAWMFRPDLTYTGIIEAILENWDPLPSLSWKTVSWKRINAYNTLAALDNYVPTKPTLTYPVNWTTYDDLIRTYMWTPSTDKWVWVSGYIVQISKNSSFTSLITEETVNTNGLIYDIPNVDLDLKWTYYWRVKAFDAVWNTWEFSDTFSFTYNIEPPHINISIPPDEWSKSKSVYATVSNNVLEMKYAISDTNNCTNLSNSSYINYTIWSPVTLNNESYNWK